MKRIALIIFFLFSYSSSQANEKICGWIMDEPFKEYQKESGRPLRAYEAALFQWVNPKAWTIAITVASGFMPLEEKLWIAVLFTGLMSSLVSFPCISIWALFGSLIKTMISNQFIKKLIEFLFALLLILTGFYLVLN